MKVLIVVAIILAIGFIALFYKRDKDLQKLLLSSLLLGGIITAAVLGNMMRSVMPFFLAHIIALIFAYGGLILYIFRAKNYWYLWILPVVTLLFYFVAAWIGNEHITF